MNFTITLSTYNIEKAFDKAIEYVDTREDKYGEYPLGAYNLSLKLLGVELLQTGYDRDDRRVWVYNFLSRDRNEGE